MTMTPRSIADVRAVYRSLRDRCLTAYPTQQGYVMGLWNSWDSALARFGDETVIDRPYLDHLTRAITASDAEILEWLDAYPDAVVDRMPGGIMA